jgi:hypothetical protein
MLGVKTYERDYVDACRARVRAELDAYDALAAAARAAGVNGPIDTFEPQFLRSMVLVLDQCFVHRLRGVEGKNGNPLNEVRVLAASILENEGVLVADKTIKPKPESSVLGLSEGDPIVIGKPEFDRLADGFFAEIEARFT